MEHLYLQLSVKVLENLGQMKSARYVEELSGAIVIELYDS